MIITEGVFSMDGDVCRLDEICDLAQEFNCRLMLDEAHSFGVLGEDGRGACELFDCYDRVDIIMGTFSKVCGGIGGFISGRRDMIDWLSLMSKAYMFSVSLPPSTVAAASEAIQIFLKDPTYVRRVRENIAYFTAGLKRLGFKGLENHQSAVVPVVIGDALMAQNVYLGLLNRGILTTPIVFPAVSASSCRIRFTMTSAYSSTDLDFVLTSLKEALIEAGFGLDQLDLPVADLESNEEDLRKTDNTTRTRLKRVV